MVANRHRNTPTTAKLIEQTAAPLTTLTTTIRSTPFAATTVIQARTTRIVRKKIQRTPVISRKPIPSTTTAKIETSSEILDEEVASVLPALTSVMPRQTQLPSTRAIQTFSQSSNLIETSSNPTTSFEKILEHQYKIKGLDKDYEDEKVEEDEKLIGVLGSQVSLTVLYCSMVL